MVRNNIVSIDTEYNKNGDLLSVGISNKDFKIDFFIKNKVDKTSYKYHGLAEEFLINHGISKDEIKNISKSIEKNFNIIVGFDILKDLHVLGFKKISSLYEKNRIIDLKSVLDLYGKNQKLDILCEKLNIKQLINDSLEHSSSYDSMVTYLLLFKFFEIEYQNDFSFFNDFISDLTKLSTADFNNNLFEIDRYYSSFSKINNKISKEKKIQQKNTLLRYYIKNDFIHFINEEEKIKYRFPSKYMEYNKLNNFEKYNGNKIDSYGIKFFPEVIKNNTIQYSF